MKCNSTLAKALYKMVKGHETGNKAIDTNVYVSLNTDGDLDVSLSVWHYRAHVVEKCALTWREYKAVVKAIGSYNRKGFTLQYHWSINANGEWVDSLSI